MVASMLNHWLDCLKNTMHFESRATTVFERLIHGQGPGLLVLWGPTKIANKTYFLNIVEAFQKSASPAKEFVSSELWRLLGEMKPRHYQCVNVIKDCPVPRNTTIYRIPLAVVVPLALAVAARERGLVKKRNIVILCNDIHEFIQHNKQENEQFLRELAGALDKQTGITFLGASRLDWNVKAALGWERVLQLGWD